MPSVRELKEDAFAILRQRFPDVARVIDGLQPLAVETSHGTPDVTLICRGVHLTSCVSRRAEAELQAREVALDARSATVYGLALGDLPRVLLERPALSELSVVLLNPALFSAANRCSPMSWLGDPRVRLLLGRDQTRVARPFAVAPACLRLAEDAALRIRDLVQQELTLRFQQQSMAGLVASLGTAPEIAERLGRDGDVAALYGSHANGRALVVAAGPSLERALPFLRQARDNARLIAVTTALRVLAREEIVPDLVVAVDRRLELGAHFDDLNLQPFSATPLVYLAGVHPRVLDRWPGPRVAAFRAGSRDAADYPKARKADLFCSGTVTHAAVDLAQRLGASEIVLVGVDFCFPENKAHAGEAPLRQGLAGVGPTALNGHGQRVPSNLALLGYLRDLETYIAENPKLRFLNWGREGAAIEGATWLD
jgi:hypothetical protein